jgi:hypothetical protein
LGDSATVAGWFHATLKERSLLSFAERLDVFGNTELVAEFLKTCTSKDPATSKRVFSLGGQIAENKYTKEVSNSQRVFYISLKHLASEKTSQSYTRLLTQGALRLAKAEDIAQLRKIYHSEAGAGEDSDSEDDEDGAPICETVADI